MKRQVWRANATSATRDAVSAERQEGLAFIHPVYRQGKRFPSISHVVFTLSQLPES